jgi:hypothetical protein
MTDQGVLDLLIDLFSELLTAAVAIVQTRPGWRERFELPENARSPEAAEAQKGSVAGSATAAELEDTHWLCPIEDRRRIDSPREGMIEGFSLGSYLVLVDYTRRLFRQGKAMISREVAGIFERIGTTAETWQARMQKLSGGRLFGRFLAARRQRLREVTQELGLRRSVNLASCLVN